MILMLLSACLNELKTDPNADTEVFGDSGLFVDEDGDGLPAEVDCDDTDPDVGATWVHYADADGDGYGNDAYPLEAGCEPPSGYAEMGGDCDDADADTNPGADEYCDGHDDDCDGLTDEDDAVDATNWFIDTDVDGFGNASYLNRACTQPSGYVSVAGDCDDANADIHPNADEICDGGVDNDCDGLVDDMDVIDDPSTLTIFYVDNDLDTYGEAGTWDTQEACEVPTGYSNNQTDCDDGDPAINPGATETCGDGVDNDCDPTNDLNGSTWYTDADVDGYGDATETGFDDCDDRSADGYVTDNTDCDDADADTNPGADEYCDGHDDDCDGDVDESDAVDVSVFYRDFDSDGYGDSAATSSACSAPSGYVSDSSDCDDTDGDTNPGADEYCDGHDDNCDGTIDEPTAVDATTWYLDDDGDGYGESSTSAVACDQPSGYVDNDDDCDDTDASASPGAYETYYDPTTSGSGKIYCGDGVDNDCDGDTDSSDWECQDEDGDSIVNGIDMLHACDTDSDGVDDALCVSATSGWTTPWSTTSCLQQTVEKDSSDDFTSLSSATSRSLVTITISSASVSACPLVGTSSTTTYERAISSKGADGTTSVDTSDCTDWQLAEIQAYCDDFGLSGGVGDSYCYDLGSTYNDGCDDVNWAIRLYTDASGEVASSQ